MPSDLLAARTQMAASLGFHIIFAGIGVVMPLLMVLAEWRWRRTGDQAYRELAGRWARGTAILFAVGAVSGTVLSFELGLLWPGFMRFAGSIIGMPFSLEGFAFFTEAIFLGIYLYGWERIGPRAHLMGAPAAVLQPLSGDISARVVAMTQPTSVVACGIFSPPVHDAMRSALSSARLVRTLHQRTWMRIATCVRQPDGTLRFLATRQFMGVDNSRLAGVEVSLAES